MGSYNSVGNTGQEVANRLEFLSIELAMKKIQGEPGSGKVFEGLSGYMNK
jgi:hypothetical protein